MGVRIKNNKKNRIRKTPPYTKRKILEAYSPKKGKKRLALQKRKGWKITIRKSTSLGNYTSRTIKNYAHQPQTRLLKKKKKKKKKTRDTTIKKVYNLGIEFIIVPIRQPNLLKRKGKGKKKKPVIQQLIKFANSYIKKKVCKFGIEINQHNQKVYSNKPTKFINKKKNTSHKHPRRI